MASFIIGTTPIFSITLDSKETYEGLGTVFFRFKQGNKILDIDPVLSEDKLTAVVKLTQEQTLEFDKGNIQCQLMGVSDYNENEVVRKSEIFNILAKPSLIEEARHNEPPEEPENSEPSEPTEPTEPSETTEPTDPTEPQNGDNNDNTNGGD